MSVIESANNLDDLCRVCGKYSNRMISLFGIRKKGLMLADMLAICTQSNVQRTDRFPSNICNQCLANLEIAFDFIKQVKASEDKFRQILKTNELAKETQSTEYCAPTIKKYVKSECVEQTEIFISCDLPAEPKRRRNLANEIETLTPEIRAYQQEMYERRMHRLFECFMCKEKIISFQDMRRHLRGHNNATPFKCKICSMYFSAQQYEQHLCKGQSVPCDYCSESFQTTKSLLDHLDSDCHVEQHNLHKCPDCSKLFPMVFLLECHRAQHRGPIEKPYVCHICTRAFRVNFLLTKHLATHSDDRRKCID